MDKLIIFSDAARYPEEDADIQAVRTTLREIDWVAVELIEREQNIGGAANLITGISQVLSQYPRAIILEDDTLPAHHFYESLCRLLDIYADDPTIFSVGGYPSLMTNALPDYSYDVILSPRFSIWGWGTWADRWQRFQAPLYDFQNPFTSLDDVPIHAGQDMPDFARQAESYTGDFFWTGPALALLSLYYNLRHAHTKHYLVNNIGLNTGQHAADHEVYHTRQFFALHNQMIDSAPTGLPNSAVDTTSTDQAIQAYITQLYNAMRRDEQAATSVSLLERLWHRILSAIKKRTS